MSLILAFHLWQVGDGAQPVGRFVANCQLLTTKCAVHETEILGRATRGAMHILKQYRLVECGHKRTFVNSEKCFKNLLVGGKEAGTNYFVATQVSATFEVLKENLLVTWENPLFRRENPFVNKENPLFISRKNLIIIRENPPFIRENPLISSENLFISRENLLITSENPLFKRGNLFISRENWLIIRENHLISKENLIIFFLMIISKQIWIYIDI